MLRTNHNTFPNCILTITTRYGLARGFSYDELSEEEKRGRKHKNKVVLEAERQAKVALDKVEKYAVQTHTFHLAVLMGALTNLQIGTEHR